MDKARKADILSRLKKLEDRILSDSAKVIIVDELFPGAYQFDGGTYTGEELVKYARDHQCSTIIIDDIRDKSETNIRS